MRVSPIAAAMALSLACGARAEVVEAQPGGFEVRQSVQIAATPAQVYETLVHVGTWWDSDHTFSGDAGRLRLEPVAGGCFCETLPGGGSVAHLRVVYIDPGKAIRLEGALGPLQALGGTGHLAWTLTPKAGGTEFVQTYDFGGYAKGGLVTWAGPVDSVLGEQAARMKRRAEGGKP
jgi:uncharacterized protein YndB with AHSA1/START domain